MKRIVPALVLAIATMASLVPAVVAAGDEPAAAELFELSLSKETVIVNDWLSILGRHLLDLRDLHVRVGGASAWPERWSDTEIRFRVPATERGAQDVVLEPKGGLGTHITVGTVDVAKAMPPLEGAPYQPGVVYVRLAPGADPDELVLAGDVITQAYPDGIDDRLRRWYRVDVEDGTAIERIHAYAALADVEVAEYDGVNTALRAPSDPDYGLQSNVRTARLPAAWEVRTTGAAIAVLDTGIRASHQEFQGLVLRNRDHNGAANPPPCDDHGSHVAAIAMGRAGNGAGIAGAAWSTGLGSYRVLPTLGPDGCGGSVSQTVAGINAAVADGFRVINMSIARRDTSGSPDFAQERDAVQAAWNAGAVLVAAAGNRGSNIAEYPAAHDNVLAVANSAWDDSRYSSSNWGGWVDVAAPGVNVYSATAAGDASYAQFTGTSMSSPLVAGIASLLLARGMSNAAAVNAITSTTDPVNWGNTPIAGGRVNAYRAITARPCLRDLAVGAWVQFPDERIFQVTGATTVRQVPHWRVLESWKATTDWVRLCAERAAEYTVDSRPWGFRPGRLVRNPSTGVIYLITTDGTDRGLPTKRAIADANTYTCFGWSWTAFIDDIGGNLAQHPDGPVISSCLPGARAFPNGSIVRSDTTGVISVVEAGVRRPIADWEAFLSWFDDGHWQSALDAELTLIPSGESWGYRQGRLIKKSGEPFVYLVGDDGILRARGSKRMFIVWDALAERGYGTVAITSGVASSVMALHAEGAWLESADDMP